MIRVPFVSAFGFWLHCVLTIFDSLCGRDGWWMDKILLLIFTKSVGAGSETTIIASLTGWAMLSGFIHSAICLKNLGCHPWGGWTSWIWPASGMGCGRVDGLSFCNGWNRSGSLPDLRWCSFSGFCSLLSDLYGGEALKDAQKDWWDGKRCRGLLRKILDVPWSVRYRSLSTYSACCFFGGLDVS